MHLKERRLVAALAGAGALTPLHRNIGNREQRIAIRPEIRPALQQLPQRLSRYSLQSVEFTVQRQENA
jgi:hypothetical protein